MASFRSLRFPAGFSRQVWPILSRLPVAAKLGFLGAGGAVGGAIGIKGVIGATEEERGNSRFHGGVSTSSSTLVQTAAHRFGFVVHAAEKRRQSPAETDAVSPVVIEAAAPPLHKYFTNNNGKSAPPKNAMADAENDVGDANANNKCGAKNGGGVKLEDVLNLDEKFLVASPVTAGTDCGTACGKDDAAARTPFVANPMLLLGPEVDGLDRTLESLALDNSSLNADGDDDEEELSPEDAFEQSKANPFNKSIETLVDEALRWHDKLMKEPPGICEPYDQVPEESFGKWVGDADRMFRERKFEDLKEKLVEEHRKTRGRMAKRDPQLCWRLARLTFLMGNEVENNTVVFWKDAMIYAIEGIRNFEDPKRAERVEDVKQINHNCCWKCHLWFGIIMAKLGGLLSKDQRKRISVAFMAKQHLERAIQINPLDPIPHFALAKWHSEFCKLNAGQNKIVRELGHEPPVTDLTTAMRYAQRANELSPKLIGSRVGKFPRNVYLLAELHYMMGHNEEARYFVKALVYQLGPFVVSMEDRRAVERAKVLWMKLDNPTPNNPNDSTPRAGKARPTPPVYPEHHGN